MAGDLGWSHSQAWGWQAVSQGSAGPACTGTFQVSSWFMFANLPLAKASHMTKPRVNLQRPKGMVTGRGMIQAIFASSLRREQ